MSKKDVTTALVLGLGLFALYAWTAPRSIAFEDDGLFVVAAYQLGLAHPPGYPLHTLLGHLFSLLPVGGPAYRLHLMSGFFGAVTAMALWVSAVRLCLGHIAATVGALGLGVSLTFWSQAIVTEVYTLHTALFFWLLALALRAAKSEVRLGRGPATVAGLLFGLGLSNHWPLLLLSVPGLLFLVWPVRIQLIRRAGWLCFGLLIGLTPYLWLFWNAAHGAMRVYPAEIRDWGTFWEFISRQIVAGADSSPTAGWRDKIDFARFFGEQIARQFTWVAVPLLLVGAGYCWRFCRRTAAGLWVAALGPSLLLIGLLDFDFDPVHQMVFRVYPLVAYGVAALFLAAGFARLIPTRYQPAGAVCLVGFVTLMNFPANDRHAYTWAARYGETVLQSLPPDARLVVNNDRDVGVVGYLHEVEGLRPDVELVSTMNARAPYRTYYFPDPIAPSLEALAAHSERPLCYFDGDGPVGRWGEANLGAVSCTAPELAGVQPRLTETGWRYLYELAEEGSHSDTFTEFTRRLLLARAVQLFAWQAARSDRPEERAYLDRLIGRAVRSFEGKVALAKLLRRKEGAAEVIPGLLARAEAQAGESIVRRGQADLFLLRGDLAADGGALQAAARLYREALRRWPSADNPAVARLQAMVRAEAG